MSDQAKMWLGMGTVFGVCWLGAALGILSGRTPSTGRDESRDEQRSTNFAKDKRNGGAVDEVDDPVHDFFHNAPDYEGKEVTLIARIFPAEMDRPDTLPEDRQRPFSGKKASLYCLKKDGQKIEAIAYVPQTLAIPEGLFPSDRAVITFQCGLGKLDVGNQVTKLKMADEK